MTLAAQIEAILFWQAEPVTLAYLSKAVGKSEVEVQEALKTLESELVNRGVQLMWKDNEVMLGTTSEASGLIEKLTREALSRDLGKATLETLTAVLYQGPIARARIDYLRGVNSSFILRHLMVRGLIERVPNPQDARSYLYQATFQLLQRLGLSRVSDLPEYSQLAERLAAVSETNTATV